MLPTRTMARWLSATCGVFMLATVLTTAAPAVAQKKGAVGSVRSLAGTVQWRSQGTRRWQTVACNGLALGPGDEVRTGKNGRCCLVIGGTRVTVGPNSVVRMPAGEPRGGVWHALRVLVGRIILRVFGDRQMEVVTPAAKAGASGTVFAVEVDGQGVTAVTVAEGQVVVANDYGSVTLGEGQKTTVVPGQAPTPPVTVNLQQTLIWQGDLPEMSVDPHLRLAPEVQPDQLDEQADAATRQAQARPDDLAAQLRAAALLYDAGKVEEAAAMARRAAKLRGGAKARAILSLALLAQGRPTEAAEALEGAASGGWHDLAAGALRLSEGGEALAEAVRLLAAAAEELPIAQVPLAVAAMRHGQADVAAQAVAAALKAQPGDGRALALRAMLALARGDLQSASKDADSAAAMGGPSELAEEAAALVAFFTGDFKSAAAHAARAVELAPQSGAAQAIAADVAAASDDLSVALEHALQAVALDPSQASAWRVLGMVYAAKGSYAKAASCLERALELRPKMVSAYSTLAVVYSRQGKIAEALKQLQTGLSLGSDSAQLENDLGALLVNLGRLEEGIEHLKRAAALAEQAGHAWALPYGNLALAYLDLNEFAQAEEMVLKALDLGADSAAVHTLAARVYIEQDRYDRALAELRRALEIDPDYALARVKLAEVYHRLGQDRQAAKETLQAGLSDAGAMVEERFYSRTELTGQVGSHLARVKTDGRGGKGKVSYFASYSDEELPRWRQNGKFQQTSGQVLAGGRAGDRANNFLRVTYDRVDQGRPGPVSDPDRDYTSRGEQVTVEVGRRE
ncbi:MAG: tetratricopeptide repeat protein, partial [Armatimonadetes bacterium]|nr:tetratricopeptide repeat protein [Armatimonadota bacterium]